MIEADPAAPGTPTPATSQLLYLLSGDPSELAQAVDGMQAGEVADALDELPPDAAGRVLASLPFARALQVLEVPALQHRAAMVQGLEIGTVAPLIAAMSAKEQAELWRELPEEQRQRLVPGLDQRTRSALAGALRYPPDTAGGIMTPEFLTIPSTATVSDALRLIRAVGRTTEPVYALYLVDAADGRLRNVVSLRELVVSEPTLPVLKICHRRKPRMVDPYTDREEVARLISKYDLLAVPVVAKDRRILGVVTVDNVIDTLVAESTEDAQKFGGLAALDEPYTGISLTRMLRKRAGWLSALFIGEMLTATAMGHFEGEIQRAVVLALFVPLIISSGGNSGSQATSLIIRALALRELRTRDWWRVALRELPCGLLLGAFLGVIGATRILLWQALGLYDYGPQVGLVALTVAFALIGVVGFGSLTGAMLPFMFRRLGLDPASASAPFVATLVDVTGLVIYFTVALLILRPGLL
jgi:magnesium transporter